MKNSAARLLRVAFALGIGGGVLSVGLVEPQEPSPQSIPRPPYTVPFPAGFESPPEAPLTEPSVGGCGHGEGVPSVYLHSGELHLSCTDLRIPGRGVDFVWARKYRSRLGPNTAQGNGWDFSYDIYIRQEDQAVRLFDGNTRRDLYLLRPGGIYTAVELFREGQFNPDGTLTLTFADAGTWNFNRFDGSPAEGKIASSIDRNGNALFFQYDGLGRLAQVTDTLNRPIAIAYDGNGRIQAVTDFTGRSVTYAYYGAAEPGGSPGDLKSMTTPAVTGFPLGKTTTYAYSQGFADERLNHNLLTITDPKGQTWLANTYATTLAPKSLAFDRLVRQRRGNAGEDIKIETELVPLSLVSAEPLRVIVNDRVGNVMECYFDVRGRLKRKLEFTGRADPAEPTTSTTNRPVNPLRGDDPPFFETVHQYNADSLVTRTIHPNGNVTENLYELALDPAAPWRARGNLRERHRRPGTHLPVGDQSDLVELFEYQSGMGGCCGVNFVTHYVDARGHETFNLYDSRGNKFHTLYWSALPLEVEEDWEYDSFGQMTAHVLPASGGHRRRDEFHYYGPADGAQNGYLEEEVVDTIYGLMLTTRYEYDAVGNVVRRIDRRGHDELFTVNARNQVEAERSREWTPASGIYTWKYRTYDGNDNLIRLDVQNRDESGVLQSNSLLTTSWTHGILNEVLSETREVDASSNVVTEYAYDANLRQVLVRKGEAVAGTQPANTITTLHDERGLPYRIIRAAGDSAQSTEQRDYDGNGNLRATRQGQESGAHATLYTYDAYDRRVSVVDPLGNLTEHHYDPNGNLGGRVGGDASPTNPFATRVTGELLDSGPATGTTRLSEEQYAYSALDRIIQRDVRHFDAQTQAPIGDGQSTTTLAWSASSYLLTVTGDGPGQSTSYEYDSVGRRHLSTDAKGNSIQYSFDENGNVVQTYRVEISDLGALPQTFVESFTYDSLDRQRTHTAGTGNTWNFLYDSRGNRVRATDPLGHATRYVYDGLDRLVQTARDMNGNGLFSDPADVILQSAWDQSSRKKSETDDKGNTTRYAYDALDRLIVTQMADGTLDQVGAGAVWLLGQPAPDLSGFTPGYDAHEDVLQRRDAVGSTVVSAYDALDRPLSRSITRGPSVLGTTSETYQYDGLSRLIRAQDDDSIVTRGSVSTSGYDSLGDVLRETQRVFPAGPTRTVTAAYDGRRNQTLLVYAGARAIARTYDVLDRPLLVREDPAGAGTTIANYWYVGSERLERRDYGNSVRFTVGYDGLDGVPNAPGDFGMMHMRSILHTRGATTIDSRTYLWDRAGNETQAQRTGETRLYTYDALDRLVTSNVSPSGPSITYALDGAGNRTSVIGGPDPGAYSANAVNAYTSTPFDTRTSDANGNLFSQTGPTRTYRYDYRNQLVQFTDAGTGQTTTYRYDCLGRRIERNVGGTITRHYYDGEEEIEEQNGSNATSATWAYSKGQHSRLQMVRGGQKYYYSEDELGSVRKVTDASGAVTDSVEYDDYGTPTVTTNSTLTLSQAPDLAGAQDSDQDAGSGLYSLIDADNFVSGTSGQLTTVRWWGAYSSTPPPASDDFYIQIRANSAGLPGALIAQRHVGNAVSRAATGQLVSGFYDEYSYQATLSPAVSVSAGTTYWLVVYANTAGYAGTWRWEQSYGGNGLSAYNYNSTGWSASSGDYAYELDVTTGPPPSGNPFLYLGRRTDPGGLSQGPRREEEPRTGRFIQRDTVRWWRWSGHLGNAYTFAANAPVSLGGITDTLLDGELVQAIDRGAPEPAYGDSPPDRERPYQPVSLPRGVCKGSCFGSSRVQEHIVGDMPWSQYPQKVRDAAYEAVHAAMDRQEGILQSEAYKLANAPCNKRIGSFECSCGGGQFRRWAEQDFRKRVFDTPGGGTLTKEVAFIRYFIEYWDGHCAIWL